MRPGVMPDNYEYEAGKPDDLTPSRMAELVVGMIRAVQMVKPFLPPLTDEEKRLCEAEELGSFAHDIKLKSKARRLYRKGLTQRAIAEKIGVPQSTVAKWCCGMKRHSQ